MPEPGVQKILADQSTLPQPGGQIMPLTLLLTPPDFLTFRHPCLQLQHWLVPTKLYIMHLVGEEIKNIKNWKLNKLKVTATTYTYLTEAEIVDWYINSLLLKGRDPCL